MSAPREPGSVRRSTYRVTSGLDLFDAWSEDATQAEKNVVHRAIFSIVDRTVFQDFITIDSSENDLEYFILAKNDLVIKVAIEDLDSFGILYIGPSGSAPGLDSAGEEHTTDEPEERLAADNWESCHRRA